MDTIFPIVPEIPESVQEVQIPVPHEFKFITSVKRKKGCILYAYNRITDEIFIVPVKETVTLGLDKDKKPKEIVHRRVILQKDCVYLWSLNFRNAKRKVNLYLLNNK